MRPPPIILLVLAFGAGLATGLTRFWDPRCVVLGLLLAGLWWARRLTGFLCLAAALGRLSGGIAVERQASTCSERLPPRAIELSVALLDPVPAEGGRVMVAPLRAGCHGPVSARWPAGSALDAGAWAVVGGRWIPSTEESGPMDGTFLVQRVRRLEHRPDAAARLRTWIQRTTLQLFGVRAPTVDALVLNSRGSMDPQLRNQYSQSGLVHILSISGFHVGLIVAWVVMIAQLCRIARTPALFLGAGVSLAYVAFLGWPAPATRAAVLAVVLAFTRLRQRRVQPDALLATTCLAVMLADPWAVLDLGAWLSAGALWGATTFSRWSDHALGGSWWWRTLSSSIGATVATAPITAAAFGTVSLVGVGLNFVAIPLAAVAVPGILLALLLSTVWQWGSAALAAGSGAALAGLDGLARLGAAIPGGCVWQPTEWRSAAPWVVILGAACWGIAQRATVAAALHRWAVVLALASWGGVFVAFAERVRDNPSALALHLLDVGQGDAAVVRTPGGHWVMIDGGPTSPTGDAGQRVVLPFLLRHHASRLSVVMVSHAHADHLGGVPAVLERLPPALVLEPGEPVDDPLYLRFLDRLETDQIPWKPGRPGDHFEFDGVRFTLVHPDTTWGEWRDDLNEDSLVLLIQYGDFEALFPGDAGLEAESRFGRLVGPVDLLKVGHHGSRSATGVEWLARLAPKAAVISTGRGNRYGHPHAETVEHLRNQGVAVWRTDRDGSVTVLTDGRTMTIESRGREQVFDVRDPVGDSVNREW